MDIEFYHEIESEISKIRREINESKYKLRRLIKKRRMYEKALVSIGKEANPCKACNGYGMLKVWLAQDDSHLETCERCGGSGVAPQ